MKKLFLAFCWKSGLFKLYVKVWMALHRWHLALQVMREARGAANTSPIWTLLGDIQWGTTALATANTAKDGTGTVLTVFTANATNGGFVREVRFRAAGTNIATVARVFINNGSSSATPGNNILIDEITLSATTLSEVAALAAYVVPLGFALPPAYVINLTVGTAVAAGYYCSVIGGKY